jgi:hypothetical protein
MRRRTKQRVITVPPRSNDYGFADSKKRFVLSFVALAVLAIVLIDTGSVPSSANRLRKGAESSTVPAIRVNHALATNGGVASASSESNPAANAINGSRTWANGGQWRDGTQGVFPDWLQVAFGGTRTINEISIYGVRDDYSNTTPPDETTIATIYTLIDFDVEYWSGTGWALVPGGDIRGNNLAWVKLTFPEIQTSMIRVTIFNAAQDGLSRIVELEAFGDLPVPNCALTSITSGQTINGSIEPSDCEFKTALGDFYQFEALEGDQITMTTTSKEFDTYLELLKADGTPVTEDDDGGTFSNSRIVHKIEEAGTYLIWTRAYRRTETGQYEINFDKRRPDCQFQPNGLSIWLRGDSSTDDSAGTIDAVTRPEPMDWFDPFDTFIGFSGTFTPGTFGHAFRFLEGERYRGVDRTSESLVVDRWTVAGWIKPISVEGDRFIAALRTRHKARGFNLFLHDGKIRIEAVLEKDGRLIAVTENAVVPAGIYTHVAAAFEMKSQSLSIFINGSPVPIILAFSGSLEDNFHLRPGDLYLGRPLFSTSSYSFFGGEIDEFMVFNRRLSPQAVASISNSSLAICSNQKISGWLAPKTKILKSDGDWRFSDSTGKYELYLERYRDHVIRPQLSSHRFSPESYYFDDLQADSVNRDFQALLANDDFANAMILEGESGHVTGRNTEATREVGEPQSAGSHSVWYRWRAPRNGQHTFSLAGSEFDTLISVYKGDSLSTLDPIASNDDIVNSAKFSQVTFSGEKDSEYFVVVDGNDGDFSTGQYRLIYHPVGSWPQSVVGKLTGYMSVYGGVVIAADRAGRVLNSAIASIDGSYTIGTPPFPKSFHIIAYNHLGGFDIPAMSPYIGEAHFFNSPNETFPHIYDFFVYNSRDPFTSIEEGWIFGVPASVLQLTVTADGPSIMGIIPCLYSPGSSRYACFGLPPNSTFRITPNAVGISFSPAYRLLQLSQVSSLNFGFSASPAPSITISGRALSPKGLGVRNVQVSLTKPNGEIIETTTSSLGFYSFGNLLTGQEYSLQATSKRYRFASLSITPTNNVSELDLVGLE